MKKLSILILSVFTVIVLNGQSIRGIVQDNSDLPVGYCNVALYEHIDSALVSVSTTDTLGQYHLMDLKKGTYYINVSSIGFEDFTSEIITIDGTDNKLDIALAEKEYFINEVVIKAKRPTVMHQGGKTVISLDNTILAGQNISSLLRKVPGIIVKRNQILVGGASNATVLINGRSSNYLDMSTLLQDFPAENISKIEIIKQADASMEASGTGPIINIVLKRNKLKGTNGSISNAIGEDNGLEYSNNLNFSSFHNSLNVEIGLSNNQYSIMENLNIYRHIDDLGFSQVNKSPINPKRKSARIGLNYYMGDYHSFGISSSVAKKKNLYTSNSLILIKDGNEETKLTTNIDTEDNYDYLTINPYYEWRWDKEGNDYLKLDFRYLNFNSKDNFFFRENVNTTNQLFQNNLVGQNGNTLGYSSKIDIQKKLGTERNITLRAGYRNDYYDLNNTILNFNEINPNQLVPSRENNDEFLISDKINAVYGQSDFSYDKLSFALGLRWENSSTEGYSVPLDTTTTLDINKLFPSLSSTYKISDQIDLNASYSYRIKRPNYNTLNPFAIKYDPLSQDLGNPRLAPEFVNNYSFRILYENQPALEVNYLNSNGTIFQAIFQDDLSGEIIRKYINIDKSQSLSIQLGVPLFMIPKIEGGGALIVNYKNFESNSTEFQYRNELWSWMWSHQITINLPLDISLDNYFYFGSGLLEGSLESEWFTNTGLEISRKFFDKKLSISFSWDDIIPRKNILSIADNSINGNIQSYDSFVYVSFRTKYKFGKQSIRKKQKSNLNDSGLERLNN